MLSVVVAIVAAACFIFMLIALSYAFDLAEKLERVEAELEECRRRNSNRAGAKASEGWWSRAR
jgi:hypothetical protein